MKPTAAVTVMVSEQYAAERRRNVNVVRDESVYGENIAKAYSSAVG